MGQNGVVPICIWRLRQIAVVPTCGEIWRCRLPSWHDSCPSYFCTFVMHCLGGRSQKRDLFYVGNVGVHLKACHETSNCSNLSFRLSNVGIEVDSAFESLGIPRFCWVTFLSDSGSFSTILSGYFWFGSGRYDALVGMSGWVETPVLM